MNSESLTSYIKGSICLALFLFAGQTSSRGQSTFSETYCVRLKEPSDDTYFMINSDSLPRWAGLYEEERSMRGKLLSRFNEAPLRDSTSEVFRSITFGPFNRPQDVQIFKIEKRDNRVEITVKFIQKSKDSTILVHRTIVGSEVWDKFQELASKYFTCQPSFKSTRTAIHDGSTTVYEGYLFNKYKFLERQVISLTDPDLDKIRQFLFKSAGDIFGINCKKNTREN
jgi:hypothetical protein